MGARVAGSFESKRRCVGCRRHVVALRRDHVSSSRAYVVQFQFVAQHLILFHIAEAISGRAVACEHAARLLRAHMGSSQSVPAKVFAAVRNGSLPDVQVRCERELETHAPSAARAALRRNEHMQQPWAVLVRAKAS